MEKIDYHGISRKFSGAIAKLFPSCSPNVHSAGRGRDEAHSESHLGEKRYCTACSEWMRMVVSKVWMWSEVFVDSDD